MPRARNNAFTFEHLPLLEEAIETYTPALVVIDPVTAYMGKTDIHRANEVQALMGKLTRLAERSDCAIVCIRHPAKPGQHIGKVIHRGLGSVGFIGTARTALFAESHPTDPTKVLLGQSKSNMERHGRTQLFTKEQGQFQWGGVSRISAEMMGARDAAPIPRRDSKPSSGWSTGWKATCPGRPRIFTRKPRPRDSARKSSFWRANVSG